MSLTLGFFRSLQTQANMLEGLQGTKKSKVFFSLGIAFAEAVFIWNNAVNPIFTPADGLEVFFGNKKHKSTFRTLGLLLKE